MTEADGAGSPSKQTSIRRSLTDFVRFVRSICNCNRSKYRSNTDSIQKDLHRPPSGTTVVCEHNLGSRHTRQPCGKRPEGEPSPEWNIHLRAFTAMPKKKRKAAPKKAPADEEVFEVAEILNKRLNKDKVEYQVRWKGYGADADTWEPVSHLDTAEAAIEAYEAKLGLAKPKLSWPYAAARGEAADPTRTKGYHAPAASFKKEGAAGPAASSVQSSPQRTSERVTDKRASRWKSGRNVRVEYRVAWVDGDGDEQEEWVLEEKVEGRGLQKLVDDYNRDHGNAEAKVVNTGAVLSRGSSRNLPAGMALPDAAGATGAKKGGGKKPSSIVGTRTKEGIDEVKVKWADSADSTWMACTAFATKFGKPLLTKMTKSLGNFGDAAWSGSPISPKDAAKRWPNRDHDHSGPVKNYSAVTVDGTGIKLGDTVKVLVQQVRLARLAACCLLLAAQSQLIRLLTHNNLLPRPRVTG